VGLDIGTSRIKFIEARLGKGGILISNAGIGLTPRDAIANGVIVDADVLGSAVRQLLDQHGCKTKAVISSVASQSSLVVRPIEVPRMTRQELAQTMQWEVERHIPFAASEVVMDFQPLVDPDQLPPDVQNMDVLLAVAQEDMINAHIETLFRAGLDPQAVDVEPLSACRALVDINRDQGAYERSQALLSIGATTTDLSIIRQGLLSFTRPVPLAGDNITNAIAEALGYEFHEAERVKLEEGRLYLDGAPALQAPQAPAPPPAESEVRRAGGEEEEAPTRVFDLGEESPRPTTPPPPQEPASALPTLRAPGLGSPARQVYDAMLPTVVELVQEVRRSVEYYVNRFPDSRVDGVLLFGGTARLPNLPEFLSNEIAIPVEVGNPFLRLEVDPGVAEEIIASACMMTVAAGLAIRDLLT
jgi:type IV pilus assembly protein PilM